MRKQKLQTRQTDEDPFKSFPQTMEKNLGKILDKTRAKMIRMMY